MNQLLEQYIEKTNIVFENIKKPAKNQIHAKDHIELANQLGLYKQASILESEYTSKTIKDMGFIKLTISEATELILPSGFYVHDYGRATYPNSANNIRSETLVANKKTFEVNTSIFVSLIRSRCGTKFYNTYCGGLQDLKVRIPYGIMLRIKEIKEMDYFDYFRVVAPSEMWNFAKEPIKNTDPILLATKVNTNDIKEGFPRLDNYFIARWDLLQ